MVKSPSTIVVLAGGTSGEREVSLRSGQAVSKALTEAGLQNTIYDVTSYDFTQSLFPHDTIAFPVLHGKDGEDGYLQKILDSLGVLYVGSGREASELCFDKSRYRALLSEHDFPIADGELVTAETFESSRFITHPFVLKPIDGGSSIDTYIVRDMSKINLEQIKQTFMRHPVMLIEELAEGVEITVGILGDKSLPVVEIVPPPSGEFDYENKYNGATEELCPPEHISRRAQQAAQKLALRVHQLTGCRHYSRTDMIVRLDDSIIVLETNTLPGMTAQSLYPKAAHAAGIPMPELTKRLVSMAS